MEYLLEFIKRNRLFIPFLKYVDYLKTCTTSQFASRLWFMLGRPTKGPSCVFQGPWRKTRKVSKWCLKDTKCGSWLHCTCLCIVPKNRTVPGGVISCSLQAVNTKVHFDGTKVHFDMRLSYLTSILICVWAFDRYAFELFDIAESESGTIQLKVHLCVCVCVLGGVCVRALPTKELQGWSSVSTADFVCLKQFNTLCWRRAERLSWGIVCASVFLHVLAEISLINPQQVDSNLYVYYFARSWCLVASLSLSLSLSLSPVSVNFFVACGNYARAFLSLYLSLCGLRRPFSLHACERISFWVKERPLSIRIDFSRTLGIYMPEIKKSHVEGHLLFLCFFFSSKEKIFFNV